MNFYRFLQMNVYGDSMNLNDAYILFKADPEVNKEVFGAALLGYCTAILKKDYGASYNTLGDAISETCLEVWRQLPDYKKDKGKLTTFFTSIIRRNVINLMPRFSLKQ